MAESSPTGAGPLPPAGVGGPLGPLPAAAPGTAAGGVPPAPAVSGEGDGDAEPPPVEESIHPPDPDRTLRWLAALSAAGLPYRLAESESGWVIHVPTASAERARRELDEYERVNRNWPPPPPDAADYWPYPEESVASFTVAIGLIIFYTVTGPAEGDSAFTLRGCAEATDIVSGQWWRAATALTLHADPSHVLGNAACGYFFGQALARHVGSGLGWLLILLSGVLGNLVAAWFGEPGHSSVGASTATFGALGILSVLQVVRNWRRYGNLRSVWSRAWLPAAAGVAMLGLMGTGPRSDLQGHVYGFVAGLVLGLPCALYLRSRLPEPVQYLLFALFVATACGAWWLALL